MTIPDQHENVKRKDTKWGKPWITGWKEVRSTRSKMEPINKMEGQETLLRKI